MYYFYILHCCDGKRYYGYTSNLKERLKQHNAGKNKSTSYRRPVKLVYCEMWDSKAGVMKREQMFKSGRTHKATIDKMIQKFSTRHLNIYE